MAEPGRWRPRDEMEICYLLGGDCRVAHRPVFSCGLCGTLSNVDNLCERVRCIKSDYAVLYSLSANSDGFLIVTITSGITEELKVSSVDPGTTHSDSVQACSGVARASVFFLTYMITQGLAGAGGALIQLIPLILHYIQKWFLGRTPRQAYRVNYLMPAVSSYRSPLIYPTTLIMDMMIGRFGTILPRLSLLATIGFAYSIIAPLISLLALVSISQYLPMSLATKKIEKRYNEARETQLGMRRRVLTVRKIGIRSVRKTIKGLPKKVDVTIDVLRGKHDQDTAPGIPNDAEKRDQEKDTAEVDIKEADMTDMADMANERTSDDSTFAAHATGTSQRHQCMPMIHRTTSSAGSASIKSAKSGKSEYSQKSDPKRRSSIPVFKPAPAPMQLSITENDASEDDEDLVDQLNDNAFDHPSSYVEQRWIWIPKDELGLSELIVADLKAAEVQASDSGSTMDKRGVVEGNAIEAGTTTNMDTIGKEHSYRRLAAHGTAVGLSDGLMGNSEVGHLNIGAGRIVWQDIVRIDVAIKKRQFHKNETLSRAWSAPKQATADCTYSGWHLFALLETAKEVGVPKTFVHFLGDGRDTAPRSAVGYGQELLDFMKKEEYGELATIIGRYYAMDRDKRWERVKIAIDGLVKGEGQKVDGPDAAIKAIKSNYEADVTDEFLKPIIVNGDEGRIKGKAAFRSYHGQLSTIVVDGDTLFFFNYRSDRMREIASVFGLPDKPMEVDIPKDLVSPIADETRAQSNLLSVYYDYVPLQRRIPVPRRLPPQPMTNVLAEWLAKEGVKQAHIAETEKYAHITFFFNGGVEKQFENEERHMIPSPKVATYDKEPQMSVQGVADKVAEVVRKAEHEFIMCNFAPPDMVGHTGVYEAAVEAITHTDAAVGTVYEACQEAGYILLITADHGNAEQMLNAETGAPHTAHTTNPVPFIMTGDPKKYSFVEDEEPANGEEEYEPGALCDVAPTVLDLMVCRPHK
ncbi:phosphoglycerate mutase [Salix suchowensis]|nr:phosphoglycerate mutase [Salix suchowensis]